jgi:translation initiation factor 4G
MKVCSDKPDPLSDQYLKDLGIEPKEGIANVGGRTQRQRQPSQMGPPGRSASGVNTSFGGKANGGFAMGNFTSAGAKGSSSADRFAASTAGMRSTSMSGAGFGNRVGVAVASGVPMSRSNSQGGVGGIASGSSKDVHPTARTRSSRGKGRTDKPSGGGPPSHFASPAFANSQLEPIVPLEKSENRWTPMSLTQPATIAPTNAGGAIDPAIAERKVKSLLNKLTMEKFEKLSDQIMEWANKSEHEKDGATLILVIRIIFEKATDEAAWSEMYARLCRKMMERISPNVQDESVKNNLGQPVAGGQLFRKYLLNRCQQDFQRGWAVKESTAAAAAGKAADDQANMVANEGKAEAETVLYSDEYYAAEKAKRRGLGLVKFIGELFKLQMLTERIMHECIKKLLANIENPEEEDIESLCRLLTTVGQAIDTPNAHEHMNVYFTRMNELAIGNHVSSRIKYMLLVSCACTL